MFTLGIQQIHPEWLRGFKVGRIAILRMMSRNFVRNPISTGRMVWTSVIDEDRPNKPTNKLCSGVIKKPYITRWLGRIKYSKRVVVLMGLNCNSGIVCVGEVAA